MDYAHFSIEFSWLEYRKTLQNIAFCCAPFAENSFGRILRYSFAENAFTPNHLENDFE